MAIKTRQAALKIGLSYPQAYEDMPFHDTNWQLVRLRTNKKAFLLIYEWQEHVCLNVKVAPEWRDFWRSTYASVVPGYHQNKDHWNTIILDGSVPDKDIKRMIAESYDLVADSATERIYAAVRQIPRGKVATYGTIAALAGNPKMSRAVGNALHKNPDGEKTPCYRVVNAKGELAAEFVFGGIEIQKAMLEKDGIAVTDGKVDLARYGWDGKKKEEHR